MRQVTFELLELADARADLGPTTLDELQNVCAGRSSTISDSDDVAYLSDGESDCLGGTDERQSRQHISGVFAIPRRCPHRLGQ
jgi:hypothetical protein